MRILGERDRNDRFPATDRQRGRERGAALFLLLPMLLLALATTARAQTLKPLTLSGSPLQGSGEMRGLSILIPNGTGAPVTNKSDIKAGTYYTKVTFKPHVEAPGDGSMTVTLDKDHVTSTVVQGLDTGGVGAPTGTAPKMDFTDPIKCIGEVRGVFDTGVATAKGTGDAPRSLQIPDGATKMNSLDVDFTWKNNKQTLNIKLPAAAAAKGGGHRLRYIVLGVGGVAVVGVIAFLALRRKKPA
ncbi:MAG TPA: hypothetical protein VKU00_11285 [Chthonomonadaceae bacterium]|nr:hypothetical protein [Chthonomonadaceae bacterium]